MKKILVITPSLAGGSWVATEKILEVLSNNAKVYVLGLGRITRKNKKLIFYQIPYPKYESWGGIHSTGPLLALLWNIPLMFCFIILFLIKRPNLVISNGFSSSLILSPFIKILKSNLIVLYHGIVIGFISNRSKKIVKFLSKYVDLVVVNSSGSKKDLESLVSKRKIIINEHFADKIFFSISKRNKKTLNIIYVGSLNREKLFFPLLETAKYLKNNPSFNFIFIGRGADQDQVEKISRDLKNFKYLGYIGDREKLKKIYDKSDLLWSYADETYISLPATEALASGLPLIVPKYPGMHQKSKSKITIGEDIVPKTIGWLVDTNDFSSCLNLVKEIQKNGISMQMRKDCHEYAKKKYGPRNLDGTIARISSYL